MLENISGLPAFPAQASGVETSPVTVAGAAAFKSLGNYPSSL